MTKLESTKTQIMNQLKNLCAHCANNRAHACPVQRIALQIKAIRGVPLMVNNEFRGVLLAGR